MHGQYKSTQLLRKSSCIVELSFFWCPNTKKVPLFVRTSNNKIKIDLKNNNNNNNNAISHREEGCFRMAITFPIFGAKEKVIQNWRAVALAYNLPQPVSNFRVLGRRNGFWTPAHKNWLPKNSIFYGTGST